MKRRWWQVIVSTGYLVKVLDAQTATHVHGSFTKQA